MREGRSRTSILSQQQGSSNYSCMHSVKSFWDGQLVHIVNRTLIAYLGKFMLVFSSLRVLGEDTSMHMGL